MTLIRFFRTRPTADGTRVPASGTLRFTPTRERVIEGSPDEVILPISFSVQVPKDTGRVDVDLAPTGPGWVWEVYSHSFGVTAEYAYVIVPEPVPDPDNPGEFLPVDEPDLVRVDKDTLDPAAAPDPAWWAEVERTVSTGEVVGDDLLLHLRNGETLNAGHVRGLQGEQGQQGVQGEIGPQGIRGDTGAQGIQGEQGVQGESGPQGLQGLPGNATMRVDTTAGTRIFITNGATEHMLSADTKWRAIQWWGTDGVVQGLPLEVTHGYLPRAGAAGGVYVRRISDMVYMRILAITTTSGAQQFPIPNGFSAGGAPYPAGLLRANSSTPYEYRSGGTWVFAGIANGVTTETQYAIEVSWVSKSAWPTILPGIPA